jgi:hypothetical protein
MSAEGSNAEVFAYTGPDGAEVPRDVVRVRVDPSVTSIPVEAFEKRKKLAEVELCEGLVEIGARSFGGCEHSITKINIPTSLRRINICAFSFSLRTPIRLQDGIESIGRGAFTANIFTNFRVPPLITVIPVYMLSVCKSMFSLELTEEVTEFGRCAFSLCHSLRNVAIPPNAALANYVFVDAELNERLNQYIEGEPEEFQRLIKKCSWTDLQQLFGGSEEQIVRELRHRFDGLPIHKLVYYHTYHQGVLQILIDSMNTRLGQRRTLRSKLDPTGNQQDCLGMTPLHILACSSVHDIELYRVLIERYPTNLITEDRWGALPLLYAFWGDAPAEIIEFLLESYHTLYPGFEFNWTSMVETMGRTDTPKESIENLLQVRQFHFPEQPIDWEYLLDEFVKLSDFYTDELFQERMRFLVMCGMSERVNALAFKVWRDHVRQMIHTADFNAEEDNDVIMSSICYKLSRFEDELPKLKDATTILELALWKNRITENNCQHTTIGRRKKIKTGDASIRRQCRITCGADVIIGHVLPYLISTGNDGSLS